MEAQETPKVNMCIPLVFWVDSLGNLQSVGEGLVELGNLGGDAEVDGAVTDLNNQTADELGVDLFSTYEYT